MKHKTQIILFLIGCAIGYYAGYSSEKNKYDMPEEFNQYTIGKTADSATLMMVIYDDKREQFKFEFCDQ